MQPASASLRKMKEEETTNKGIKNLLRFINKSLAVFMVIQYIENASVSI